jgi:hypothetical protein
VLIDVFNSSFGFFQGLIRCELECQSERYAAGDPLDGGYLVDGKKLPRLLELGADFFDAVAPTPYHPAKRHASVLRTMLKVGISSREGPMAEAEERLPHASAGLPDPNTSVATVQDPPSNNPPDFSYDDFDLPLQVLSDPGKALASVLDGISPEIFGNQASFEGIGFGGQIDGMDWAGDSS